MTRNLGRRLSALDPALVINPILMRLVSELKGLCGARSGGFNDRGGIHEDCVNNDTDAHTDFSRERFDPYANTPHTDLSYRDGRQYNHHDQLDCCDNHTDSQPNHWMRWSYSDITR